MPSGLEAGARYYSSKLHSNILQRIAWGLRISEKTVVILLFNKVVASLTLEATIICRKAQRMSFIRS
jgi:hypothetical protein